MGQRFCTGSSSNLGNRNRELWFESLATRGGIFFLECPVTPSEPVIYYAASLEPGVRGLGRLLESYFKKQMCCNPHCSKLQDTDFPNLVTPPAQQLPTACPGPTTRALQSGKPPSNAPTLPPAPKCNGEKTPKQSQSAESSQSRPGKDRTVGDRPPARQLQEILAISRPGLPSSMPQCSWRGCPVPSYLRRSRARPRSARRNLNPCRWLAFTAVCPSPGHPGPASGLRQPRRTPAGQCAAAAAGGGSAEASAARSPLPAPRSPRPPAGACARGERGAEGGARRESREEGGEPRAGRSRSVRRPAGSRLGLNTRGRCRSSTRAPRLAPAALDLRSRVRSCELARPSPFPWRWPSLENS